MAALWVVAGVVVGGLVVYLWAMWVLDKERARHLHEVLEQQVAQADTARPLLSDEVTAKLIERLMDASLPAPRDEPMEDKPGSDAEYELPVEPVRDWTDPFFGVERETVGGLRPGQGIPGIGPDAPDPGDVSAGYDIPEDVEEFYADRPEARGFEAVGDELFDEWDANRGRMS